MIPMNISSMRMEHSKTSGLHKSYMQTEAERMFVREYLKSLAYRVTAALAGHSHYARTLQQEKNAQQIRNRHYDGLQTVPISSIRGSENRTTDFDVRFHPLQQHVKGRWIGVATEMLLGNILPPVELIKLGDSYFVRDGHHRVSAARALGQREIEASVTTWTIDHQHKHH